jgi:hypothetical protein
MVIFEVMKIIHKASKQDHTTNIFSNFLMINKTKQNNTIHELLFYIKMTETVCCHCP